MPRKTMVAASVEGFIREPFSGLPHESMNDKSKRNKDQKYHNILKNIYPGYEDTDPYDNSTTSETSSSETSETSNEEEEHECTYFTCDNADCTRCVAGMFCLVCPMCDACSQWRGPCVQCVKAKPHCHALHFGFLCDDHKANKYIKKSNRFDIKNPSEISLYKYSLIQQQNKQEKGEFEEEMGEFDDEYGTCCCFPREEPEDDLIPRYLKYCSDKDICKKLNCTRTALFGTCTNEMGKGKLKSIQKAINAFDIITSGHRRGCLNPLCEARDIHCSKQEKFYKTVLMKRPSSLFGSRQVDFDFVNLEETMVVKPENTIAKQEEVLEEEFFSEWEDSEYMTTVTPSTSKNVNFANIVKQTPVPINHDIDIYDKNQDIEDYLKILCPPGADQQLFMAVFTPDEKQNIKTNPIVDKLYDEMDDEHKIDDLDAVSINSVTHKSDLDVAGKYESMFQPVDRFKLFRPKQVTVRAFRTLMDLVYESPPSLQMEAMYHLTKNANESEELCKELADAVFMGQLFNIRETSMYEAIKRYSYYLMSLATTTQKGRCAFFELGPEIMADIYHQYLYDQSPALRRLSMKILANLVEDNTLNACGPVYIDYTKTFSALCTPDDDLRHYLLNFLKNSLSDSVAQGVVLNLKEFRLTPVVVGCISRNETIRMASIKLIDAIMEATVGQDIIQETFKESEGIYIANELLNKPMLVRMHPFSVLMHTALQAAPNLLEEIRKLGALDSFLKFLGHVFDADQLIATLRVLLKVTMDPTSRHIVAHNNMLARIAPYVSHGHNELSALACTIIAALCEKDIATTVVRQSVKFKVLPSLIEILQGDKSWTHREEACKALAAQIDLSPVLAEVFIRSPNADAVVKTLALHKDPKEMPDYTKLQYVRVIYALIKKEVYRRFLYENLAIESLVTVLRSEKTPGGDNWLMEYVVAALGRLFKDKHATHIFANIPDSFEVLTKAFQDRKCTAVLLAGLIPMIIDLIKGYPKAAYQLIKSGFLTWLVKLEGQVYLPLQELIRVGIEAIVCGYLPLKFSHYGYLDYKDITNIDHFYVLKQRYNVYLDMVKNPFPLITDQIPVTLEPQDTIYVFKFPKFMKGIESPELGKSDEEGVDKKDTEKELVEQLIEYASELEDEMEVEARRLEDMVFHPPTPPRRDIRPKKHSTPFKFNLETIGEGEGEAGTSLKKYFYEIDTDDELEDYFDYFEQIVEDMNAMEMPKSELGHLLTRIIALAKVVYYTSCGADVDMPVTQYIVKLHEAELKDETGSYVLPMGVLEYRHKFERAVLFKVLADVVGIPCWLFRNDDLTIGWVEIYLTDAEDDDYAASFVMFANLKPNYVLDLMAPNPPYNLFLPKGSPAAVQYTIKI